MFENDAFARCTVRAGGNFIGCAVLCIREDADGDHHPHNI